MIEWAGTNTDKTKTWEAEAESYAGLYHAINEKYGYNTIVSDDDYCRALLVANAEAEDKFDSEDGGLDVEALDAWSEQDNVRDLNEDEYKALIEESTSNAYYQEFKVQQ